MRTGNIRGRGAEQAREFFREPCGGTQRIHANYRAERVVTLAQSGGSRAVHL